MGRPPHLTLRRGFVAARRIGAIFVCAALLAQSVSGAESPQESGQPSMAFASGDAVATMPPAVTDEPSRDSEVTFRRSIDDPSDASSAPGTGAPDPKLVPIALSMVGLLVVIGLGTAIYAWCTRNKHDEQDR